MEADADVIGHINGGHTALPDRQITSLVTESTRSLEIVHNGNERAALLALRTARDLNQLHRVILGTDSPAGSGVQPLGILRVISALSSLGDLPSYLLRGCLILFFILRRWCHGLILHRRLVIARTLLWRTSM